MKIIQGKEYRLLTDMLIGDNLIKAGEIFIADGVGFTLKNPTFDINQATVLLISAKNEEKVLIDLAVPFQLFESIFELVKLT